MKNRFTLLLPVFIFASAPLLAQDRGCYTSLFGGFALFEDGTVRVKNFASGDADFDIENGYSVGLRFGYDFGSPRLEAEVSYMRGEIESLETNTANVDINSEMMSYGFMLNALWDFDLDPIVLSAGVGAGASRVKFGEMSSGGFIAVAEAEETVFSYQGAISASYSLNANAAIGVNYRYLIVNDVEDRGYVDTNGGGQSDIEYDGVGVNLFEVFFTYRF